MCVCVYVFFPKDTGRKAVILEKSHQNCPAKKIPPAGPKVGSSQSWCACILTMAAASSTRSMALSGKKRSVMYLVPGSLRSVTSFTSENRVAFACEKVANLRLSACQTSVHFRLGEAIFVKLPKTDLSRFDLPSCNVAAQERRIPTSMCEGRSQRKAD